MARPGESDSCSVSTPGAAPALEEDPSQSATAKRPRDDADASTPGEVGDGVPEKKRRVKLAQDVVFRLVVLPSEVGMVIGKQGIRIKRIREETKATIRILDAIPPLEERVIIISSKDNDRTFSEAEDALHQIVTLILREAVGDPDPSELAGLEVKHALKLLITGSQASVLIGASGENIEKLRNSSPGSTITVLGPQSQSSPLCPMAHEFDHVLQISGKIPAALRALVEIGCQLRNNPPHEIISINPTNNPGSNLPCHGHENPTSDECTNSTIMVPKALVGGLIGKSGTNISRIRAESGATIKVYPAKDREIFRQIQLGGGAQQVALARQRIDEYISSQNNGHPTVGYEDGTMAR